MQPNQSFSLVPIWQPQNPAAALLADGGRSAAFRVDDVTLERRTGLFKPLTAAGTIVVDGVVASVHSTWFADDLMDRLGLTHALPALYQVRPLVAVDMYPPSRLEIDDAVMLTRPQQRRHPHVASRIRARFKAS